MADLVCNGHNPCGDHSDCPSTPTPPEVSVPDDDSMVPLAIGVATGATVVAVVVVVLGCRWFEHRRKQQVCSRLH